MSNTQPYIYMHVQRVLEEAQKRHVQFSDEHCISQTKDNPINLPSQQPSCTLKDIHLPHNSESNLKPYQQTFILNISQVLCQWQRGPRIKIN